jgi:hypothetical protein
MRIEITNFGRVELLLGSLYCVFNCYPSKFSQFGYTTIYWNGKPIWFA